MSYTEALPAQFEIVLENSDGILFGENKTVKGNVVLKLTEPKKSSGMYISFYGEILAGWRDADDQPVSQSIELFSFREPLWTPKDGQDSDFIQPGLYTYPFSFAIPDDKSFPPSFDLGESHVAYVLKAQIDRPKRDKHQCYRVLSVIPVRDCNDPKYATEVRREDERTMCCLCCSSGPVSLVARIPSSSWCPGEVVPVVFNIENHSNVDVKDVSCCLVSHSLLQAKRSQHSKTRYGQRLTLGKSVPAGSDISNVFLLRIPPCSPTIPIELGRIISLDYSIRVRAHLPSGHADLVNSLPITIGTIPHQSPPLFSEQMSDPQQQAQGPRYPWANPEDISRVAADRVAAKSQSTKTRESIKHVCFMMPSPTVPALFVSNGHEHTPLLSETSTASASTDSSTESATTTTTSSSFQMPESFFAEGGVWFTGDGEGRQEPDTSMSRDTLKWEFQKYNGMINKSSF